MTLQCGLYSLSTRASRSITLGEYLTQKSVEDDPVRGPVISLLKVATHHLAPYWSQLINSYVHAVP